jgi:hypothetical protein
MRCELELDGFKKRRNVPHAHNTVFLLNPGASAFCSNDKSDDLCLVIRETNKIRDNQDALFRCGTGIQQDRDL